MQKRVHSRLTCSIGRCDEHPPCGFALGAPAVGEVLSKINLWFKGEREPCPVQTHGNASEGIAGPPPQSCRRTRSRGPTRAPWSCRRRAWGRNLALPLVSRPNPDGQPTVFCAPRRVRPEVGSFLPGTACIVWPRDRSWPGQGRGLPLQGLASVAPTARPEQSPLWRRLYRLSNLDRPPPWRQVPFRARAKSPRKRASGAPVPGMKPRW